MMQRNEGSASTFLPCPNNTIRRLLLTAINALPAPYEVNIEGSRSRRIGESAYNQVCTMSARLFAGIRFFFVKYVRNKLNAFFLDPMYISGPPIRDPAYLCASRKHVYVGPPQVSEAGW